MAAVQQQAHVSALFVHKLTTVAAGQESQKRACKAGAVSTAAGKPQQVQAKQKGWANCCWGCV